MINELQPGRMLKIEGVRLQIVEIYTFHDTDSRLDLAMLGGETQGHTMWLAVINGGKYIGVCKKLSHSWLGDPTNALIHEGKTFLKVYEGTGFCVRKSEKSKEKDKDGRYNYILFSSSDGRGILTVGQNFETSAFIGELTEEDKIIF